MEKKKTLNTRALIRFWKMIKPEHKYFYGLFLCSLFGNLLVVAMPLIMGIGIDDLLSEIRKTGIGQLSFSDIKQALLFPVLLLIGCSVLSSITSFIQERTMAALSEKITLRVRKEITKKFKTLPMSFFDNHQVGDIISRTTTGLNQLSQVLLTGINQ
ncbi:TPA: ABC transporter ATP-binding protein, partial [Enterococcus faecium]|nr:ABC transporter ATP-binding protein [Enterococcus faecium]